MDKLKDAIAKFGTILVDRRFIAAVASLALLFFAVPESDSTAVLESIGLIVTTVLMLLGWTVRPPTGLQGWKQSIVVDKEVKKAVTEYLENVVGIKIEK